MSKNLGKHLLRTTAHHGIVLLGDQDIFHDRLHQSFCILTLFGHKFRFQLFTAGKDFLGHFKSIEINPAFRGQVKIHSLILPADIFKFILGIQHNDVIFASKQGLGNLGQLDQHGFSRTGISHNDPVRVWKEFPVGNEISSRCFIDPQHLSARLQDILGMIGIKCHQRRGEKEPHIIHLSPTDWKCRI